MIWNCFCTESVKGIIDPKSYLRNYLLVSNYIKGYSCMSGVINFRMRNFGQKLKILNVKTETELELASSGIATILGSVGSGLPVSLRHQRGAHCAIVSAGQVFALSAAWTANNAPRRRTLQLQRAAGRHEAPLHCLVNVVACRLFNCGPLVTHSHTLSTSSSGEFYLNKLWYMEMSGDCWGMGIWRGSGCEGRRRMTETIPKR